MEGLTVVHVAENLAHAYIIKSQLEREGIFAHVSSEHLQDVLGGVPLGEATMPRVLVPSDDVERAMKILAETPTIPEPPEDLSEQEAVS